MQESSKKARNSSVKQTVKKTQPKTVRVYSKKISDEEFARMSEQSTIFRPSTGLVLFVRHVPT